MTPVVTITPLRRRHIGDVMAIERQVFPKPWSASLFEGELGRSGRTYVVARVGARLVGYAGVLLMADDGHVATIAVDPSWQGQQIATRLMVELMHQALALGAEQITLEVRVTNVRAQRIYQRFGFAPAGARKGYYADNGEDALVMWVHDVRGNEFADRLAAVEASLAPATVRQGFDGASADTVNHPALERARMDS